MAEMAPQLAFRSILCVCRSSTTEASPKRSPRLRSSPVELLRNSVIA
ncbi:hypothetical protein ACP4OV_023535 [Aristida adscensionis]